MICRKIMCWKLNTNLQGKHLNMSGIGNYCHTCPQKCIGLQEWVTFLLKDDDKRKFIECIEILRLYKEHCDAFLDRIVMTYEAFHRSTSNRLSRRSKTVVRRNVQFRPHKVRDGCTSNAPYYSKITFIIVCLNTFF